MPENAVGVGAALLDQLPPAIAIAIYVLMAIAAGLGWLLWRERSWRREDDRSDREAYAVATASQQATVHALAAMERAMHETRGSLELRITGALDEARTWHSGHGRHVEKILDCVREIERERTRTTDR